MNTFKDLNLNNELMQGLDELGFVEPSPIQAEAIPFLLSSKKDLTALAQTGTGKTAAFSLPILNQIKADGRELQAIILCPTRELCLQITDDIKKFSKYMRGLNVTSVYGGERIDLQIRSLRSGTNIVVGTPGRVHDLIRRKVLKLQNIKWLVLDEADEMLDMGFKADLDAVLSETPGTRQTLLFSATMSKSVEKIAKEYMKETEEISVGEKNVGAEKVTHEYYVVQNVHRFDALKRILDNLPGVYGILFCRTRNETQTVADKLKQAHYDAEALHGDISQTMRTQIMDRFKRKQVRLLVATDVAARGIDVSDLTHVINYKIPDQDEAYTHRSGRTGRASKSGVSISILTPSEVRRVRDLERVIGKSFEKKMVPSGKDICQKQIDAYINEVEETKVEGIGDEKHFAEIIERLKKITKEDLIKHFVTHKFNHIMDEYKNVSDLNTQAKFVGDKKERKISSENGTNLKINLGKRQGLDVKGVFGLINSNKSLKGIEVGKITLMPDSTIFSVDKKQADMVVRALNGANYRGKKLFINVTNESPSFDGRRGGNRKFGNKKKEFSKSRRKY